MPLFEVLWAEINLSSSGDTTVVPAVSGARIRVLSITFVTSAAVTVAFKSGTTILIHAMPFAANGGMDVDRSGAGTYFVQTAAGQDLVMNLSTNANVGGSLCYVLEHET